MGLGYPGGPLIDKLAKEGNPDAIRFPRVQMAEGSLDFSFSGVKTAVINYLHKAEQKGEAVNKKDVAASFQEAVCDALSSHALIAANREGVKTVALAGGVASNSALRAKMSEMCEKEGIKVIYPSPVLCTDNGAMIASAGYFGYKSGNFAELDLNAAPSLEL